MALFHTALKVRQLFDYDTWTYTYLVWDERTKEAAIIDSVREQKDRDLQLIKELGLSLKYCMETHVHADHITASGPIREATGSKIVLHKNSHVACADHLAVEGDIFRLGDQGIEILHTPGHTDNDITFRIDGALFTGDTMLVRDCGRTIGEERAYNVRVANERSFNEFKEMMDNLNLPNPKRIHISVPGNQKCGMVTDAEATI